MNNKLMWAGFFCMVIMALLFVALLMDESSGGRKGRQGERARGESGARQQQDKGTQEQQGREGAPRDERAPDRKGDGQRPGSEDRPSEGAIIIGSDGPAPEARQPDLPRPEDAEGPTDYSWVAAEPDCSSHERQSNQAKHLARKTEKALLALSRTSIEEEQKMGRDMWSSFTRERGSGLLSSGPLVDYVRSIGEAIAPHLERQGISYSFFVMDDDSVNAFAMPGGYIVINKGLIKHVENRAQLAAVIGHEMAHNDLRHCISNLLIAKEILGDVNDLTLTLVWFLRTPMSTEQEFEADQWGMELAMLAGHSPFQAPGFMDSLPEGQSWSEAFEFPISLGDPILDAIAKTLADQFLKELENIVGTHPKPPLRACVMRQWLSRHFKGKGQSWYSVGAKEHTQITSM